MREINRIDTNAREHAVNDVAVAAEQSARSLGVVAMIGVHLPVVERLSADGALVVLLHKQIGDEFGAESGVVLSAPGIPSDAQIGVFLKSLFLAFLGSCLGLGRATSLSAFGHLFRAVVISPASRPDVVKRLVSAFAGLLVCEIAKPAATMVLKVLRPLLRSRRCFSEFVVGHARSLTI